MQASVYALLLVAVLAANLPFVLFRAGGARAVSPKRSAWRLLAFVLLYVLVGLFARLLESRLMPVHEQDWPFYASTFAMFVVFAFPGFAWCYFWQRRA